MSNPVRTIAAPRMILVLGRQGENEAREVVFPLAQYRAMYGAGTASLIAQRKGDEAPYPVTAKILGDELVWTISDADVTVAGEGKCELQYRVDGVLAKSETYRTVVLRSLSGSQDDQPPYQSWVDNVITAGNAAMDAAERAEAAVAHGPIIGEDDHHWYVYDAERGAYVDTGVQAEGSIKFEELTPEQKEMLRGPQGIQGIPGPQGVPGPRGQTGEQGPKGDKGDRGETGPRGLTGETGPKGEKGDKGDRGETGATGAQGPSGADGKDYVLTEADKQEIAGMVEVTGSSGASIDDTTPSSTTTYSSQKIEAVVTELNQANETQNNRIKALEDAPSGGTTNYSDLENKPSINGVELNGNKSLGDLGIGEPTDEQVASAVSDYLTEHPEATTTVADKSITQEKLADFAVTPQKTSFMKDTPDEYLWTLNDFKLDTTPRNSNDPEKNECIYSGWYSDFKPYSNAAMWSVYYDDGSEKPFYLKLILLCYDADKNYLGSSSNFAGVSIVAGNLQLVNCVMKEGTAYVRFYSTEDQWGLNFVKTAKFYTDPVNDRVVTLDDRIVTAFIDGYNLLPMGATNLAKGCPWNTGDAFWSKMVGGFYAGVRDRRQATVFPIVTSERQLYYLLKVKQENKTDGWRIRMMQSFSCFDANKNHIGNCGYNENANDGSMEVLYEDSYTSYVRIILPEGTKYVTAWGDSIYIKVDMLEATIISEAPIPLDAGQDTYRAVKSKEMDRYTYEQAQCVIDDNKYHQFRKIGKIVPKSSTSTYQCWGHNMLHYDSKKDSYVCAIRGSMSHGGAVAPTGIALIDAKSLKSTEQVNVSVPDMSDPIWCCGFWINASGEYVMLGSATDSTVHRIVSKNYGETWTDSGVITVPDGESAKFFSVYRLSSGRLLGAYDDTVISTGSNTLTKIGLSDDDGATWEILTLDCEYSAVEQSFVEIGKTVMMLGRKNTYGNNRNQVYISYSTDDGRTWSKITASKTLYAHTSDSCAYVHDGIVEVFAITRFVNNTSWSVSGKIGQITHFSATEEQALNDNFYVREIFYGDGNVSADFTSPACAVDSEGNVLVSYADSQKGSSNPTEWHFLYSANKPVVCDGRATNVLPYSGQKVQSLIDALDARIKALEG